MTESEFSSTRKGQALVALLKEPMAITRILALSRADRPAVEAIDSEVADTIGTLSDVEKQAAGRVVKRMLGVHGLRPVKKGQRVLGGRVFSRGTVYGEVVRPAVPLSPAPEAGDATVLERAARARAILAASRLDPGMPTDTVDDFLRDRRGLWGEA